MSESTQTSRAELCDLKRCSCVVFYLKAGRKDLTNRPEVLSPPPTPPIAPIAPFLLKNAEFGYTRYEKPRATRQKTVGWEGRGGGWGERTLGLFVKPFLPAFREKQHRNIFSHHTGWPAEFEWILIYLKISVEMAVMWFLPGAIQFLFMNDSKKKQNNPAISWPWLVCIEKNFA